MGAIRDTVLHQVCLLLKNDLVDKPPELCVCPWAPGKSDASELLSSISNKRHQMILKGPKKAQKWSPLKGIGAEKPLRGPSGCKRDPMCAIKHI